MSLPARAACLLLALAAPLAARADGCEDAAGLPAVPVRPTLIAAVATELPPATTRLGGANGVLGQAYDEALSVANVLARIRIDGCRAMAGAAAAAAGISDAAYRPETAFDNRPWRFNMTQGGKRMTADEFDAWMKSRGVRVAGRKVADVPPPEAPAADAKPAR